MHHKYVVRDRRLGLDGLDELDRRLVVAGGERHRGRSTRRSWRARSRSTSSSSGTSGNVEGSGHGRAETGARWTGSRSGPWFCPGFGDALSHRIAKAIGRAKRRVRICSPVITAAPVLATLAQVIADGKVDVAGAVDQTQIEEVQAPVGPDRRRLVEAAAAAPDRSRRAASPASARRRGARAPCTTTCTRR